VPSEKRARQRAGREVKKAAEAKAVRRRTLIRNGVIVVVLAVVVVGSILLATRHSSPPKSADKSTTTTTAKGSTTTTGASTTTSAPTTTTTSTQYSAAQATANAAATAAGCPASPTTRVNTLTWSSYPPMTIDTSKTYQATVKTTAGTFTITLDAKEAPKTVNSFVFLADQNYFHCVIFHRVITNFMDQTGDPTGTGKGTPGYEFANENVPSSYATGDVAMANSGGTGSNGSQFFLVVPGGATTLNKDLASGDKYSVFGTVSAGMTVVEKVNADGSTSGTPNVTQRILSVTVHES
jgi:cyclophilin family peptidyl-prolyl cis-trans isomerase